MTVDLQELLFFMAMLGALSVAMRVNFFITLALIGVLNVSLHSSSAYYVDDSRTSCRESESTIRALTPSQYYFTTPSHC